MGLKYRRENYQAQIKVTLQNRQGSQEAWFMAALLGTDQPGQPKHGDIGWEWVGEQLLPCSGYLMWPLCVNQSKLEAMLAQGYLGYIRVFWG